jgi:hypothetical protein
LEYFIANELGDLDEHFPGTFKRLGDSVKLLKRDPCNLKNQVVILLGDT